MSQNEVASPKAIAITTQSQNGVGLRKLLRSRLAITGYFTPPQSLFLLRSAEADQRKLEVVKGREFCHSPTHRSPLNRANRVAVVWCHHHLDADRRHPSARPLLTKRSRCVGAVLLSTVLLCTGSATASADESIVIDLVRHGESVGNAQRLIDTAVPGTQLTQLGQDQARNVANMLAPAGPFAGIYASQLIRTQETAAPLAAQLGMNVRALRGLNEIDAGAFNGLPQFSLAGLAYLIAPVAWMLGLRFVPMLAPDSTDADGFVFDKRFNEALQMMYGNAGTNVDRFNDALQTMYGTAMANPLRAADGKITEVAFSSEFAIGVGTMMSVKNPDPLLLLLSPLSNTGIVRIQGNPRDGWTLVSWNGKALRSGGADLKTSRDAKGLCRLLNVPTDNSPCGPPPPVTASAAPYG